MSLAAIGNEPTVFDLEDGTGAIRPIKLAALTSRQWGKIEQWARMRIIENTKALTDGALKSGLIDRRMADAALQRAFDRCATFSIFEADGIKMLQGDEGEIIFCRTGIEAQEQSIPSDVVENLLRNRVTRKAIAVKIHELISLDMAGLGGGGGEERDSGKKAPGPIAGDSAAN